MKKDCDKNIRKVFDITFKLINMPDFSDASLRDVLSSLNPCKFKELAATALTCIMGNLDVETAFLAIIKKFFKILRIFLHFLLTLPRISSIASNVFSNICMPSACLLVFSTIFIINIS